MTPSHPIAPKIPHEITQHGITRIDAQGKPFDPNLHQAVMQQPSAEVAPFSVLQVLEQGYTIHDRVLRAARVIVAAPLENSELSEK